MNRKEHEEKYLTLFSKLIDSKCKGCNKKCNKCRTHELLNRYRIPSFNRDKKKCKYAY